MIIPGSSYWNIGMGLEEGDVQRDPEGLQTMKVLGQNMAWVMKRLNG
jgi:multimeric flavodoxin WrbA